MTPIGARAGLLSLLALLPVLAQGNLDDLQLRLARQFDLPLRWDNVEDGHTYWLGGNRPFRGVDRRWQVVNLAAGERLTIKLPAGEAVRVLREDGQPLTEDALTFRLSGGSGAALRVPGLPGDDGRSLIAAGFPGYAGLMHLERPENAQENLRVAVFVSRRMPFKEVAPYRERWSLPLPERGMRRASDGAETTYWQLAAGEFSDIPVSGPRRIAVEGRFIYRPGDAALLQNGWLRVELDEHPHVEKQYETSMDTAMPVFVDGQEAVATRLLQSQIEIPEGEHRLRLQASSPFLLRLLALDEPDYLLPALNEPNEPAREARRDPVSPVLKIASWAQSTAETVDALHAMDAATVHQGGLRLLQDNRSREGAMLATAALQQAALDRRDVGAVQREANAFLELHTFFRDLYPQNKRQPEAPHFAWYLTPRLLDIGERGRQTVAAAQHESNLLAWMDSGLFLNLPTRKPSEAIRGASPNRDLVLHFATDSHHIEAGDRQALRELARLLARDAQPVHIVGHTDARASDDYNQGLSQRRAGAVAAFLAREGISPERLQLSAHAARQPLAGNASEDGRQRNRRVTVSAPAVNLPAPEAAQVYPLPERFSPGWLRVAMHAEPGALRERVFLQFDEAAPQEFTVEPSPEVDAQAFQATAGETALLMQRWLHGEYGGSTLSPAFSREQQPARLISAGVNDIPLPPDVRQVRAWREREGEAGRQIWLALKVRMAKPYALSESAVLDMLSRPPELANKTALLDAMAPQPPADTDLDRRMLDSHLQPLARLVASEARHFALPLAKPMPVLGSGLPEAVARAKALESAASYLPALEQWSLARGHANAALDAVAEAGQIRTLFALGETFLASQRLRQIMWYSPERERRAWALSELTTLYRQQQDDDALLGLAAAAFVRDPDDENLRRLALALQQANQAELAVQAGLLLPAAAREPEMLLRAALRAEWRQVFERLLAEVRDSQTQQFWRGLEAARRGDFSLAESTLADLGEHHEAAGWLAHLRQGMAIEEKRRREGRASPVTRAEWANWLAEHPGECEWRDQPGALRAMAGSMTVRSEDRDTGFVMHHAEDAQPLRLAFYGPTTLRLEARPLHRAGMRQLIDGWLRVREATADGRTSLRVLPITQNPPSDGLSIVGDPERVPGRQVLFELNFAEGWHEIEVDAENLPLLLRPRFAQPELLLPVLPLLNPDTVQQGGAIMPLPAEASTFLGCRECTVLIPEQGRAAYFRPERSLLGGNTTNLGDPQFSEPLAEQGDALGLALARGDWARVLDWPRPTSPQAMHAWMAALLWVAERVPGYYERVLPLAAQLAESYPLEAERVALMARLNRRSLWLPLTTVQASAGLRAIEFTAGQVEAPAMRIRAALLGKPRENEYLLSGDQQLVLNLFNPQPAELTLEFGSDDVSALPLQPMRVRLAVDGRPARLIELAPTGIHREIVRLPVGEQVLRVSIDGPLTGQFLRLRFLEKGRVPSEILASSERFYQVATSTEPVRLSLPGPSWLRVDEWREGETRSDYRLLADEWNSLEFRAERGEERLFRFFTLGSQTEQPAVPNRIVAIPTQPVPEPPLRWPATPMPQRIHLLDGLTLGGQEDGTHSIFAGLRQRSFSASEHAGGRSPSGVERYFEAGVAYRYFDADNNLWLRGEVLGRSRAQGSPTLGVRGELLHAPVWSAWNFGVQGSLYAQSSGGDDTPAYAANLRASMQQRREITPKLAHQPEVALFTRWLASGMDASRRQDYLAGHIDQDVFSPYQDQHRLGAELSDQLIYQPWLDTQWFGRVGLVSNADLALWRPDHLSWSMGWRQLFGQTWAQLSFRQNHYFSDVDRNKAQTIRNLSLQVGAEVWRSAQHRLELGLQLSRDNDTGRVVGGFTINLHGGNGRAFTDFMPKEILFRDLRERRISGGDNNQSSSFHQADGEAAK